MFFEWWIYGIRPIKNQTEFENSELKKIIRSFFMFHWTIEMHLKHSSRRFWILFNWYYKISINLTRFCPLLNKNQFGYWIDSTFLLIEKILFQSPVFRSGCDRMCRQIYVVWFALNVVWNFCRLVRIRSRRHMERKTYIESCTFIILMCRFMTPANAFFHLKHIIFPHHLLVNSRECQ